MIDPVPVLAGAALVVALLGVAVLRRGEGGLGPLALAAMAAAPLGAVLVTLAVFGRAVSFPPTDFLDGVVAAGVAAVPLGVLVGLGGGRAAAGVAGALGLAVWLFLTRTESLHERYWDGAVAQHVSVLVALAAAALGARWLATSRGRTTEASLGFALAAVLAAPALGFSGTLVSALLAAAVSSSSGLPGLLLAGRPELRDDFGPLTRAAAVPQVLLLAGVLANGALYAETPPWAASTFLLAPLLCLLPGRGVGLASLRLVAVTVACGVAAWLSRGEPDPYGY
ncbi:MAG: hypothetical protein PVJ89_14545 [Planctomycetota bacterium]